jgi:hypothetical protein
LMLAGFAEHEGGGHALFGGVVTLQVPSHW